MLNIQQCDCLASRSNPPVLAMQALGYAAGASEFDAGLFAVSASEAALMDPQQRLLLESAFEALHTSSTPHHLGALPAGPAGTAQGKAGTAPGGLHAGAGVYVGISYAEYAQAAARAMPEVSTYTATGGSLSVAAGVACTACI